MSQIMYLLFLKIKLVRLTLCVRIKKSILWILRIKKNNFKFKGLKRKLLKFKRLKTYLSLCLFIFSLLSTV